MSFLLDTDICSASMKGLPAVSNRFVQYGGRLHMSAVTSGELFAWALRAKASPKRLQSLLDLLKEVHVLPVDQSVARKFGEVRAWQLGRGLSSPDLDLLNGSVALLHNLTLVTHNTQDYINIPGLTLEDWMIPCQTDRLKRPLFTLVQSSGFEREAVRPQ
jgi:tRNA(fMet)-specific endonuclease VapC